VPDGDNFGLVSSADAVLGSRQAAIVLPLRAEGCVRRTVRRKQRKLKTQIKTDCRPKRSPSLPSVWCKSPPKIESGGWGKVIGEYRRSPKLESGEPSMRSACCSPRSKTVSGAPNHDFLPSVCNSTAIPRSAFVTADCRDDDAVAAKAGINSR